MTGPLSPWASIPKGGYTGFPHNVATLVPERQHLLIRPHFLKLQAKLIFIVEASPRVWIERGDWGHYCNRHYNNILCSPPNCLLETCFSYHYPVSLIIAPG